MGFPSIFGLLFKSLRWGNWVPRSDLRGTETVFIPLHLSEHNIRYNRKRDINRIRICCLKNSLIPSRHVILFCCEVTWTSRYSKMQLRFWRKFWQAWRMSRQQPVDSTLFHCFTGSPGSNCDWTQGELTLFVVSDRGEFELFVIEN
jgi:hypothetical protein